MPRDERRPVVFSYHALKRLRERGVSRAEAEWIVRAGAVRPDADRDFLAYGTGAGALITCACLDEGALVFVKTVYVEG
jgi:hypothetical protein